MPTATCATFQEKLCKRSRRWDDPSGNIGYGDDYGDDDDNDDDDDDEMMVMDSFIASAIRDAFTLRVRTEDLLVRVAILDDFFFCRLAASWPNRSLLLYFSFFFSRREDVR